MAPSFDQVPPEIFAKIFEIGLEAYGLSFLPSLCLVCRAWNTLISSTPRLWGIISINKHTKLETFNLQLAKSKSAPLRVYSTEVAGHNYITAMLASVASRWERAEVRTNVLALAKWEEMMNTLEVLSLYHHDDFEDSSEEYFRFRNSSIQLQRPKLYSFAASALSSAWITNFLSPSITVLRLSYLSGEKLPSLDTVLGYLAITPNLHDLELSNVSSRSPETSMGTVHLPRLTTLTLSNVWPYSRLLQHLRAPSLQTLSIVQSDGNWFNHEECETLSPVFSQWSHEEFIPSLLHTLNLQDCTQPEDVPYLIRWLARLKNLVRLTLRGDTITEARSRRRTEYEKRNEGETNFFTALSSPHGAGDGHGWLCPSLMQLHADFDLEVTDLIPVARARGGIIPPLPTDKQSLPAPNRLRLIEANLCPSGTQEEIEELKSMADDVGCICLSCNFELCSIVV